MGKTLTDIKNDFINDFGARADRFGWPRIAGQLEGLLFFAQKPMSLDEMAERLEVSKASVSTNIRILEQWRIVRKVYNKGKRKNYYEIRGDISEIKTEIMSTILKNEIINMKTLFDESTENLKNLKPKSKDEKNEIKFINDKLKEIKEYIEAAEYFLDVMLKSGKITPTVIKKIKIT